MLRVALMVTAYTAVVTIAIYLAVYSKMYDWWKNSLGRVMNFSLVATSLIALGAALRFADDDFGRILTISGWIMFTVLLVMRLRLLLASGKSRQRNVTGQVDETLPGVDVGDVADELHPGPLGGEVPFHQFHPKRSDRDDPGVEDVPSEDAD